MLKKNTQFTKTFCWSAPINRLTGDELCPTDYILLCLFWKAKSYFQLKKCWYMFHAPGLYVQNVYNHSKITNSQRKSCKHNMFSKAGINLIPHAGFNWNKHLCWRAFADMKADAVTVLPHPPPSHTVIWPAHEPCSPSNPKLTACLMVCACPAYHLQTDQSQVCIAEKKKQRLIFEFSSKSSYVFRGAPLFIT